MTTDVTLFHLNSCACVFVRLCAPLSHPVPQLAKTFFQQILMKMRVLCC